MSRAEKKAEKAETRSRDEIANVVWAHYERLKGQASQRLANYDEWEKWFKGDKGLMWSPDRPAWRPSVIANLIESKVRTKVAILTDSKPKFYVYGVPEVDMLDGYDKMAQIGQAPPEQQQEMQEDPQVQQAMGFDRLTKNMNTGLDHVHRFNEMNEVVRRVAYTGAQTGLLSGRVYWDADCNKRGEIKIEPFHPRYLFFDENVEKIDLLDGSCDVFIVAIPKPLTWFNWYFPGMTVDELPEDAGKVFSAKMGMYIEAYFSDDTVVKEVKGSVVGTKPKYPNGRKVVLGGHTVLMDEEMDIFPYVVKPYEMQLGTLINSAGDIEHAVSIQEDFNSKMSQISLNIALSANRQWIVNAALMGMDIEELMTHSGEAGYMFPTKKTMSEVKEAMMEFPTPEFEGELFQYVYYLPQLLDQVMGIPKVMEGMSGKKERQSQYEIGKQYETATIRIKSAAHNVEMFLTQTCQTAIEFMKKYWTEPRKIYGMNESNGGMAANIFEYPKDENGEPIDYDFIVTIQPETMLPVDLQSQAERDMQLYQMSQGQVPDLGTLLESLHHPKRDQIVQKVEQQRAMQAQAKQGQAKGVPT